MIDAAISAFQNVTSLDLILPMLLGVSIGFVIGLLPGLGGTVGLSIALPFMFGVDPFVGIALLVGLSCVNETTCTYPAILLGVPSSGGSTATVIDGYQMARNGEAARGLGASFSASMLGGIFGGMALLVVILVARPLVQALTSPDLFMLTVLGMATVGVLVSGDVLLGVASAVVGLMLGTIGGAPATPEYRYVFGELYLYGGLSIVVIAMGIFAIPEVISLLVRGAPIARTEKLEGSVWDGFKETWRHKALVWRSSVLGTFVGAVPGLGGSVVDEMAYAMARLTSRDTSQFGKGDVRGVIAPEAANNAKEGGALMPTLILGIPGSGSTAVLMGALVMMGLSPGPQMVEDNLDITLTIVWTLVMANVVATGACLLLSRWISRITLVPGRLLAPLLIVLFFAAGYQTSRHMGDIVAILAIGVLGYFMKTVGWPRVPLMVGFVLSGSLERYLHLSISRYQMGWLTHGPVVVIGICMVLVLVVLPVYQHLRKSDEDRKERNFV